jgi:hypothetical protein
MMTGMIWTIGNRNENERTGIGTSEMKNEKWKMVNGKSS